jgi:hypothetical protein
MKKTIGAFLMGEGNMGCWNLYRGKLPELDDSQ